MNLESWEKENIERGAELIRIDFTNLKTGGRARLYANAAGIDTDRREIREALEAVSPHEATIEEIIEHEEKGAWSVARTPESTLAACLEYILTPKYRARRFRDRAPQKLDAYDVYFVEYLGAFLQGKRGSDLAKVKRDLRNDYLETLRNETKLYRESYLRRAGRAFDRALERRLENYRPATE